MSNKTKYIVWNGCLFVVILMINYVTDNSAGGILFSIFLAALFYRPLNHYIEYRGADYDEQGRPYPKGF